MILNIATVIAGLILSGSVSAGSPADLVEPVVVRAQEKEDLPVPRDTMLIKMSAATTGGQYSLVEDIMKPGFANGSGAHIHHWHTETFYVIDGEADFLVGDKWVNLTKGDYVFIPPGTPHAVASDTGAHTLMIYTPGGFEENYARSRTIPKEERSDPQVQARLSLMMDLERVDAPPRPVK